MASVHLCVLLGPVHGAEPLHVLLDVLLRLVLHVLVALQVLGISASFQLLIHDSVSKLSSQVFEILCVADAPRFAVRLPIWIETLHDELGHLFAKCLFTLFSQFTGRVCFSRLCGELGRVFIIGRGSQVHLRFMVHTGIVTAPFPGWRVPLCLSCDYMVIINLPLGVSSHFPVGR